MILEPHSVYSIVSDFTISFEDTNVNEGNTEAIYKATGVIRTYVPGRQINQINGFEAGAGYYVSTSAEKLDLTNVVRNGNKINIGINSGWMPLYTNDETIAPEGNTNYTAMRADGQTGDLVFNNLKLADGSAASSITVTEAESLNPFVFLVYNETDNEWSKVVKSGTVGGSADNEDLILSDGVLKFADKENSSDNFAGLGRVFVRKNISGGNNVLTPSMISEENTRYIIQYDYDLDGADFDIPANCVLQFDGGSFKNGSMSGNNTSIISAPVKIFDGVTLSGTYNVELYTEWFGAIGDGSTDDTESIRATAAACDGIGGGTIIFLGKIYLMTSVSFVLKSNLIGKGVGVTILRKIVGSTENFITIPANGFGFTIRNMSIVGNNNQVTGGSKEENGNGITLLYNVGTSENHFLIATKPGVSDLPETQPYKWSIIENVLVQGFYIGIDIQRYSFCLYIRNCFIGRNSNRGISAAMTDSQITDTYIYNNGMEGLYCNGSNNKFTNLKVIFSAIRDKKRYGIFLENGNRNLLVNVESQDNHGGGMMLNGNYHNAINILLDRNGPRPSEAENPSMGLWMDARYTILKNAHVTQYNITSTSAIHETPYYITPAAKRTGDIDIDYEVGIYKTPPTLLHSNRLAVQKNNLVCVRASTVEDFETNELVIRDNTLFTNSHETIYIDERLKVGNSYSVVAQFVYRTSDINETETGSVPVFFTNGLSGNDTISLRYDKERTLIITNYLGGIATVTHELIHGRRYSVLAFNYRIEGGDVEHGLILSYVNQDSGVISKLQGIGTRDQSPSILSDYRLYVNTEAGYNAVQLEKFFITTEKVRESDAYVGGDTSKYSYNAECYFDFSIYREGVKKLGATGQRPALTAHDIGHEYFDTSLLKPIYWAGDKWVDATGADV